MLAGPCFARGVVSRISFRCKGPAIYCLGRLWTTAVDRVMRSAVNRLRAIL